MKKLLLVIVSLTIITGCNFDKDKLENANIRTTSYPITYLVNELYGEYSTIKSIYPEGVDEETYKLTTKQIKRYSKENLFVYNGLTEEKETAKTFVNKNKNILLIDATYSLNYKNDISELWLSPNNYLMLAKNIKDNLSEYLTNKFIIEKVNENYDALKEKLSIMDADLRKAGSSALEKSEETIVVTSNAFKYLENYDFIVVSLEDLVQKDSYDINKILKGFKDKTYSIFINDASFNPEGVDKIIQEYGEQTVFVKNISSYATDTDYLSDLQEVVYKILLLTNLN